MTNTFCLAIAIAVLAANAGAEGRAEANRVKSHYRDDLAGVVDDHIRKSVGDWLAYYTDLHAHPELSLREEKSAGKMAARLKAAGYAVTERVGGFGVVGVLANGSGPTVLIRGDMDALPIQEETGLPYASGVIDSGADGHPVGVMHACGHDVHQSCLAGAAAVLADTRDRWSGTVLIIAQPAEEVGIGARAMIADGLFERFPKPDYCLALHVTSLEPTGNASYTSGWAFANVDSVDITIHGVGGHGSRPHGAVDPIVAAAQTITALQTVVSRRRDPIEPGVVTVGSVHAGSKHNIIPNEAKLEITVRSYDEATRRVLLDGIREVTVNTCRAMGCPKDPDVVVREAEFTPALYNDPDLTAAAAEVLKRVLGEGHVSAVKPEMGGEDFGVYGRTLNVPSLMFRLGSMKPEQVEASRSPGGPRLPSLHSSKYAPDPKPTIESGVKCLSAMALSLLESK